MARRARGGRDQFSWEDVVNDRKHRDNYLGHSLFSSNKASFNNARPNALWWTKQTSGTGVTAEALRQEEERLMLEELGVIPKTEEVIETQLDKGEIQRITERGFGRDPGDDRMSGLGFGEERRHQRLQTFLEMEGLKTIKKDELEEEFETTEPGLAKDSTEGNGSSSEKASKPSKEKSKKHKEKKKKKHKSHSSKHKDKEKKHKKTKT